MKSFSSCRYSHKASSVSFRITPKTFPTRNYTSDAKVVTFKPIWRSSPSARKLERPQRESVQTNIKLDSLVSSRKFEEAEEAFQKMKTAGTPRGVKSYNVMIKCYQKWNKPDKIDALLKEMKECGIRPTVVTYTSLISGCNHKSKVSLPHAITEHLKVMHLWNNMKQDKVIPDLTLYNCALSSIAKSGNLQDIQTLRKEMIEAGFKGDVFTYCTLIDFYGKQGCYDKLEETLKEMELNGVTPNKMVYNSIINAHGKSGNIEKMLEWYEKMANSKLQMDIYTFNIMIDALGRVGDAHGMEVLYKQMKLYNIKPDLVTFNSLINSYANSMDITNMMKWFRELQLAQITPDERTFSSMIYGFAKAGEIGNMLKVLVRMKEYNIKPTWHSFAVIIQGFANNGDVEAMLEWWNELKSNKLERDISIIRIIVQGIIRTAPQTLATQLQRFEIEMDSTIYNYIINRFALDQKVEFMEEWFERMKKSGCEITCETLNALLLGYQRVNQLDTVWKVYNENRSKFTPSIVTFTLLINTCTLQHQPQKALELKREMEMLKIPADDIFYASMIICHSQMKDLSSALEYLFEMEAKGFSWTEKVIHSFVWPQLSLISSIAPEITRFMRNIDPESDDPIMGDSRLKLQSILEKLKTYCINKAPK